MTKLFDDQLGIGTNSRELAALKLKHKSFDPAYVSLNCMNTHQEHRDWIESIWAQYQTYADSNFQVEFKTQFYQRAWELYLGTTLINRGHLLGEHSDHGPDLNISQDGNGKRIWIEAVTVKKGEGEDRVPEIECGRWMDVPEEKMLLRLTSGIVDKYKKYQAYLGKIIAEDDPFVIAVDRSSLEHPDPQIPLILKCLFAIRHQVLFIKKNGEKTSAPTGDTWTLRENIEKKSGTMIESFLFGNSEMAGVSAIIYSNKDIINAPREPQEMGNHLVIVHNPYAKNPIPYDFFKFGSSWAQTENQIKRVS